MATFQAAAGGLYFVNVYSGAQADVAALVSEAGRYFVIYQVTVLDVSASANTILVEDESANPVASKELAASGDLVVIYPRGLSLAANTDLDFTSDGSACLVVEYEERNA